MSCNNIKTKSFHIDSGVRILVEVAGFEPAIIIFPNKIKFAEHSVFPISFDCCCLLFSHYGRDGDCLLNDGSRAPKVQGGVKGYLSVM